MKKIIYLVLIVTITIKVNAQTKKEKDQNAIKAMCGCFEVGFNFVETFSYSKDSTYQASSEKHDKGLEWVQLVADNDDKIVLQHLLIVGKPTKPHVIKHWRQDWLYQNTDFYMFTGDNTWKFIQKPYNTVIGQWTQQVYQVDDSPRYQGSATWVHVDGKSFWENTTDAPLPRREYTIRNDYNVTVRTNRHEITPQGWIHDQDNNKVVRNAGQDDFILAQEKGINNYIKVADSKCKAAINWWQKNKSLWQLVRTNWAQIFSENKNLELREKVNNKKLYKLLFNLESNEKPEVVNNIIKQYVKK